MKKEKQKMIVKSFVSLVFLGFLAQTVFLKAQTNDLPDLIPYRKGYKWGFCDKNKKIVIECKYDMVSSFSEGLALVQLNGKYGFIDKSGKEVITFKYDVAYDFSEGLARVILNKKWGFIDKSGKEVIPFKYDWAKDFSEGLALVKLNDKYG
ncbi:MAG: WG repeat-containing protein, partial [Bacteroidales bacterium]|nr:WG repeat-containing protein [Bacteroidales bacterium]